ncbi:class IV adenylate cyclase [Oxalobacter vibrioformis]|uniref:class IV adenylate cyclase n=1 Tax=Oxalobacter vibrioformis TaxID=933080 RepID=UPI002FCD8606
MKLRIFSKTAGELIFYQREDRTGPTSSFYVRTTAADPAGLHEALTLVYGEIGQAVKERALYMIGRTRIHLDRVKGIGDFIELEVVLEDDESPESGIAEARRLMADPGIASSSLVASAYIDLINAKTDKG